MSGTVVRLLLPDEGALLLVDQQAGLAFGVGSIPLQKFLNNVIALAITARAFGLSVVVSTSATTVGKDPYSFFLDHSSALARQLLRRSNCLRSTHQEHNHESRRGDDCESAMLRAR